MCLCNDLTELWDDEAKKYIEGHLRSIEVKSDGWEVVYDCPNTGFRWIEDYPRSEEQGGGPMRLRRLNKVVK